MEPDKWVLKILQTKVLFDKEMGEVCIFVMVEPENYLSSNQSHQGSTVLLSVTTSREIGLVCLICWFGRSSSVDWLYVVSTPLPGLLSCPHIINQSARNKVHRHSNIFLFIIIVSNHLILLSTVWTMNIWYALFFDYSDAMPWEVENSDVVIKSFRTSKTSY